MNFKVSQFLLLSLSLSGCVSNTDWSNKTWNVSTSGTSQFDDTNYIRLSNVRCQEVEFELYQSTQQSKRGVVRLKAGSRSITNIRDGESLLIKLDDKTYTFTSLDSTTEYATNYFPLGVTSPFSRKGYIVPESFVRTVASSNVFLSKMYLLNNTYIEGKCSEFTLQETRELYKHLKVEFKQEDIDMANNVTALKGFRKFVKLMDSTKW